MKISVIIFALFALVLLVLKYKNDNSNGDSTLDIPSPITPVNTDTDPPTHWFGRDFSGNMSLDSLGGAEGGW